MKAIKFPEQTHILAENQEEYKQLPVHVTDDSDRQMISCHKLNWRERIKILFTGKLWHSQLTFGSKFSPTFMTVNKSDMFYKNGEVIKED